MGIPLPKTYLFSAKGNQQCQPQPHPLRRTPSPATGHRRGCRSWCSRRCWRSRIDDRWQKISRRCRRGGGCGWHIIELLDATVVTVRHIDISAAVYGYAFGVIELSVTAALAAPLRYEIPVTVELLDAMVVSVRHIDISAAVYGYAIGVIELSVTAALSAPLG